MGRLGNGLAGSPIVFLSLGFNSFVVDEYLLSPASNTQLPHFYAGKCVATVLTYVALSLGCTKLPDSSVFLIGVCIT
jgi:hypothetical protein